MARRKTIEEMEQEADVMIGDIKKTAEAEVATVAPSTPQEPTLPTSPAPAAAEEPAPPAVEPKPGKPAPIAVPPTPSEPTKPEPTIEELRSQLTIAEKRYKDAQSALTPVQQERAELRRAIEGLKQEIAKLKETPPAKPSEKLAEVTMPQPDPEQARFEEDYPEVASYIAKVKTKLESEFEEKLTAREKKQREEQLAIDMDERETAILEAHPDVAEISKASEFQEWLDKQPNKLIEFNGQQVIVPYRWINDNALLLEPEIVNEVLGEYKESKKPNPAVPPAPSTPPGTPQPGITPEVVVPAGAVEVVTPRTPPPHLGGGKTYTKQEIDRLRSGLHRMSPEEQEKVLADIDRSLASA